ncbi:hypothetical protein HZH68_000912 [Vespula germanica]|uniref:Uncharacterized protein n=1 Tax=Vespula germanica TaxID=30212 RepID=A0A834NUI7_VESGE|nr:hypothetical protein HZH68_000912 [Vespula germanica]
MIGRLGTSLLAKEAKVETKREGEILYLSKTRQSGLLEDPQQSISRAACLNPRQQGPLLVSSDNRASGGRSGNTPGAFQCLTEGYVRTVRVVCVDSALTILRVDLGTLLQLIVRAPCLDQPAHFPIRSRLRSVEGCKFLLESQSVRKWLMYKGFSIGFSVDMEDIGEGPCSDKR